MLPLHSPKNAHLRKNVHAKRADGGNLTPFDSTRGAAASNKRWAARRHGTIRAIYDVFGASNIEQASYEMAVPMASQLKAGGRGIAPIFSALLRAGDLVPDKRDVAAPAENTVTVALSGNTILGIAQMIISGKDAI